MTVVLPAFSSGSMTRSSASKPLSAITMSASICGSKMSAPSRSQACPGVSAKPVGLPKASTVALILVLNPPLLRPIASSSPAFFWLRRCVDERARWSNRSSLFVVGVLGQILEDPLPDAGLGPAGKARMNRLPVSEALGQVPPRHAGSISVQNRLNEQTIVRRGHAHMPQAPRQQILDPVPFVVVQSISPHRSALLKADRP